MPSFNPIDAAAGAVQIGAELYGGHMARGEQRRDRKLQRQAMQEGIRWRVKDAQLAGIHPLYALGAPTFSPSPTAMDFGDFGRAGAEAASLIRGDRAASQRHDAMAQALMQAQIDESKSRALLNGVEASRLAKAARGTGMARDSDARNLVFPPEVPFRTSPTATAQDVQDQYGDVVEAVYGIGRLLHDIGGNVGAAVPPYHAKESSVGRAREREFQGKRQERAYGARGR